MQMAFPMFFIFTIYAVINGQFSVFLSRAGYSATEIGILFASYELFGTYFPLALGPKIEKCRSYGIPLLIYGLLTVVLPLPVLTIHKLILASICFGIYSIGLKGMVPLSDSVVNNMLGSHYEDYGKVRAIGSFGFVVMQLIMQFFSNPEKETLSQMILWTVSPAVVYCLSLFTVKGLVFGSAGVPAVKNETENQNQKSSFISELKEFPAEFWIGIMLTFFAFLGISCVSKFLSLYVVEVLKVNAVSLLWAISAFSEIPLMCIASYLIKRFGSTKLLIISAFSISIRLMVYVLFPSLAGAVAAQIIHCLNYGLFHPAAISFVAERVHGKKQITGLTVYSVLSNGLAYLIGSALGGFVIDNFGFNTLFCLYACFPIVGIALYFILSKLLLKKVN